LIDEERHARRALALLDPERASKSRRPRAAPARVLETGTVALGVYRESAATASRCCWQARAGCV
jgi:hypothetical protein